MKNVRDLIAALQKAMPELDPKPLLDNMPKSQDEYTVLDWLYEHLNAQRLIYYFEWKEYFGEMPDLKTIPVFNTDESFGETVYNMLEELDWPVDFPQEIPYFEYMNYHLKNYGLELISFNYENAYMMCVKNDQALISDLSEKLIKFDIEIIEFQPLNKDEVRTYLEDK